MNQGPGVACAVFVSGLNHLGRPASHLPPVLVAEFESLQAGELEIEAVEDEEKQRSEVNGSRSSAASSSTAWSSSNAAVSRSAHPSNSKRKCAAPAPSSSKRKCAAPAQRKKRPVAALRLPDSSDDEQGSMLALAPDSSDDELAVPPPPKRPRAMPESSRLASSRPAKTKGNPNH